MLTNAFSRELYGNRQDTTPSRFLKEVDPALFRRIAPEAGPQPTLRQPTQPYVDYSDSQLPDEGHSGGGEALAWGQSKSSNLRQRRDEAARGAGRCRQSMDHI